MGLSAACAFRVISTHQGQIQLVLVSSDRVPRRRTLYQGPNDGLRDVPWDLRWQNGSPVDTGVYELQLLGTSTLNAATASGLLQFRVDRDPASKSTAILSMGRP